MFPDRQMTSKLEDRRAKGKPTRTHAGFAKWGWRPGISGLVPGPGRSLGLHKTAVHLTHLATTEASLSEGLHAGPGGSDSPVLRAEFGFKSGLMRRPLPAPSGSALETVLHGGLLSPFWVRLRSAPVTRGVRRLARNVHQRATTYREAGLFST